eukprot:scaffold28694_cov22-Tisochrysis_lutea.AAC.6
MLGSLNIYPHGRHPVQGTVSYIAPAGHYTVDDNILEVEFMGQAKVSSDGAQEFCSVFCCDVSHMPGGGTHGPGP